MAAALLTLGLIWSLFVQIRPPHGPTFWVRQGGNCREKRSHGLYSKSCPHCRCMLVLMLEVPHRNVPPPRPFGALTLDKQSRLCGSNLFGHSSVWQHPNSAWDLNSTQTFLWWLLSADTLHRFRQDSVYDWHSWRVPSVCTSDDWLWAPAVANRHREKFWLVCETSAGLKAKLENAIDRRRSLRNWRGNLGNSHEVVALPISHRLQVSSNEPLERQRTHTHAYHHHHRQCWNLFKHTSSLGKENK